MNANEREYHESDSPARRLVCMGLKALRAIRAHSRSFAVPLLFLLPLVSHADPARDEARAQALFQEVRCVQCQSESIADSNADIAADMRRNIRDSIKAGETDTQIRKGLYDHYGDYVLFRPRLSPGNLVLWLLPPLIVIAGACLLFVTWKKQAISRDYELSAEEAKKLRDLMKNDG